MKTLLMDANFETIYPWVCFDNWVRSFSLYELGFVHDIAVIVIEHILESSSCDIYSALWDEGNYNSPKPRNNNRPPLHTSGSPNTSFSTSTLTPVIIKMIRADRVGSSVAVSEFDTEEQLLSNMSHPNIVQLLGSGKYPRKFLVLELLDGGTLSHALLGSSVPSRSSWGSLNCCLRRKKRRRFSMLETLRLAHDLAKVTNYVINAKICNCIIILVCAYSILCNSFVLYS